MVASSIHTGATIFLVQTQVQTQWSAFFLLKCKCDNEQSEEYAVQRNGLLPTSVFLHISTRVRVSGASILCTLGLPGRNTGISAFWTAPTGAFPGTGHGQCGVAPATEDELYSLVIAFKFIWVFIRALALLPLVMYRLGLQALGQAKPGPYRPSPSQALVCFVQGLAWAWAWLGVSGPGPRPYYHFRLATPAWLSGWTSITSSKGPVFNSHIV